MNFCWRYETHGLRIYPKVKISKYTILLLFFAYLRFQGRDAPSPMAALNFVKKVEKGENKFQNSGSLPP